MIYLLLSTWKKGRVLLASRLRERLYPFDRFMQDITNSPPHRVPGTAVFMTSNLIGTPPTLLHNLEHNQVLHDRVVLLTVVTSDAPHVEDEHRLAVETLGQGFYRVTLRYGFMEEPDVPAALALGEAQGLPLEAERMTFFLGVETLLSTHREGMVRWRERLFAVMSRNAVRATSFFRIPPERVVELGMQIEL
jgi:KUP system potassium uptake protein